MKKLAFILEYYRLAIFTFVILREPFLSHMINMGEIEYKILWNTYLALKVFDTTLFLGTKWSRKVNE